MESGGVIFLDRGSVIQFFVAIFVSLVFLVVDTFVRPYQDFRCNALKVLTSMSMLITLLCGFASKLDPQAEVVSDMTLGWTLIVSWFLDHHRSWRARWWADSSLLVDLPADF